MLRFYIVSLSGLLSLFTFFNAYADETSATVVNPVTQETTTTTVNPITQDTTVTKTNPATGETTTTIITPVPSPQETVATPQGYANCFTVAAGWYKDIWVPAHQVCQYEGSSYAGVAWIEGHWICTKYTASTGTCTKWEWKAAHWVKTLEVY